MKQRYVTKYALTKGIIPMEGELDGNDFMIKENGWITRYFSKEHHETFKQAQKKAYEKRDKKIQSLKRQLDKLNKMSFKEINSI